MIDKNLKILLGMGLEPIETEPEKQWRQKMDNKNILEVEAMAARMFEIIKGDIEAIKWHAERIDSFSIVSHGDMEKLKKFLDKLSRDEIEYRAYMRIAEAMKDE